MISLKAAVIAVSAVGAVAVGGVTWASVAQPDDTVARSAGGDLPAASAKGLQGTAPKAPVPTPSCLSAPKLPGTSNQPGPAEGRAPRASAEMPELPVGQPEMPGMPEAPIGKKGMPHAHAEGKAPLCPDAATLPKPGARTPSGPEGVPSPEVPDVTELACDKLAPAVPAGSALERTALLSKGLKYVSAKAVTKQLAGKPTCSVTQRWSTVSGTPGWLSIERIKTPKGLTERELRQALKLPADPARSTSLNGTAVLQGAGRTAVVMVDPAGYAVLVDGSPVLATSPQDVAEQLAKATK
jgi:hypothetical protein